MQESQVSHRHKRDESSTLDENTHDATFTKELAALFRKTEAHRQSRTDAVVFPVAAQAIDAQADMMSPTLALLIAIARDIVNKNTEKPHLTNQSINQAIRRALEGSCREAQYSISDIPLKHISHSVTHVRTNGK